MCWTQWIYMHYLVWVYSDSLWLRFGRFNSNFYFIHLLTFVYDLNILISNRVHNCEHFLGGFINLFSAIRIYLDSYSEFMNAMGHIAPYCGLFAQKK